MKVSKKSDYIKMSVQNKDSGKTCVVSMGWDTALKVWYNTDIVVRDAISEVRYNTDIIVRKESPIQVFCKILTIVTEKGWWK